MSDSDAKGPLWWRASKILGPFIVGVATLFGVILTGVSYFNPSLTPDRRLNVAITILTGNVSGAADKLHSPQAPSPGPAPTPQPPKQTILGTDTTKDITIDITGASIRQNQLTVSFAITNRSAHRLYYRDARSDNSQILQVDGGSSLSSAIANMSFCNSDFQGCVSNPYNILPTSFDYVDAGKTTTGSLSWNIGQDIVPTVSTVAFGIMLVGKSFDGSPNDTGQPTPDPYRFSFRNIPVSK